jgi:hypothetical protein
VLKRICIYIVHMFVGACVVVLEFNLDEIIVNSDGHRFNG